MFDKKGVYVPVKNYECVINTGDSPPIAVKTILYGPQEIPIMRECIAALEKVGHIQQVFDGPWLFMALLAAKPYQEQDMEVLCQLHSPQLRYQNNCLPYPMVRFENQ